MKFRVGSFLLLFVTLSAAGSSVWAQIPADPEFQVNTYTPFDQWAASAAAMPDGGFIVILTSSTQDGSGLGVFARRFDAAGVPRGPEFQVATTTAGNQYSGSVTVDPAGNFVVAWTSDGQDGSGTGIFARRFDAEGVPQGPEFQVNTYTTGAQGAPTAVFDAARNLMITWTGAGDGDDAGLFAQRFHASGGRQGSEFRVNSDPVGTQSAAALAADGAGRVVVAWSTGPWWPRLGVWWRRYDVTGAPLGAEIRVDEYSPVAEQLAPPGVAADPAGNFVVSWSRSEQYVPAHGRRAPAWFGIYYASLYDADGAPRGRVRVMVGFSPWTPVAGDAAGNFVTAWDSWPTLNLYADRYDSSGTRRGSAFRLNGSPPTSIPARLLVSDPVGNLLAVWTNDGGDGSLNGVFAQRFGGIVPSALAVDTAASGGSDGNRVLEPGESVDVRPAWRNVNGATQTFDGAGLGFSGPRPPA